jgi:predicted permease
VIGTIIREGVLIAAAGAAIGTALAAWLVLTMPTLLPRTPRINELALDWRALTFIALSSLLAVCAFSLVPAVAGTRSTPGGTISSGARGATARGHLLQKALVAGQVALSVVLVGSAMLLLRSYYTLTHVDTGFDASEVMTFHVGARWDEDRTRIGQLQTQLLDAVAQLPHVRAAGLTNFLPATGATQRYQLRVDGLAGTDADGAITAGTRMIGGDYLAALRAPLLAGSWCPRFEVTFKAPGAALVNQRFVDEHAPGQNLVGRSLRLVQGNTPSTIVGVIGNLAEDGPGAGPVPYLYTCSTGGAWPDPEYVARTSDPRSFAMDLRRIVRDVDPTRAIFALRPLQDVLDDALDQPRLDAGMLSLFAASALTLAAIGLYSLFMLMVSERAREWAVRLALGAAPGELVRLVLTGAGRLLAAGLVLGLVLTIAADRLLRGVLFASGPLDLPALFGACATLALVCAAAVAGPALKAGRSAPIEALRGD